MGKLKGCEKDGLKKGKYIKNLLCEIIKKFKILFKLK